MDGLIQEFLTETTESINALDSDIEMPGMNGYEFAKCVKSEDSKWKDVPLVALSSPAAPQDLDRGKAAGFNGYVAKFDREALFNSISHIGGSA